MLNKKNIAIVIQARMGSSRLPGKVLKHVNGKPMIQLILDSLSQFAPQLIVATTIEKQDDLLSEYIEELGVRVYRGNEKDVLSRFQIIARELDVSHIVRLCADSPFITSDLVLRVLRECDDTRKQIDLFSTRRILSNGVIENFSAVGLSVDVINKETLISLNNESLSAHECEHVIPAFFKSPFSTRLIKLPFRTKSRFAVDTIEDLKYVNTHYEDLLQSSHEIFND